MFNKFSPGTKVLVFPIFLLIALIVLFFLLYKIGYLGLIELRNTLDDEKKVQMTMEERLLELQNKAAIVESYSTISVIALPEDPPSLAAITQLKQLAESNGLTVGEVSTTGGGEAEINDVNVEIQTNGDLGATYAFLLGVKQLAPLMSLQSFEISAADRLGSMELNVATYFASLPETLSEVDEPINKITENDLETMARLNSLTRPSFNVLEPTSGAGRPNPFVF